ETVTHELRTPGPHERQLTDGLGVGEPQAHGPPGARAASLQARLTREDDSHAVAERALEAASECGPEPVAVGEQTDHRDDAPRDTQHREQRTRPIAEQTAYCLSNDVVHLSYLNASAGGSLAARRAGHVAVTMPTAASATSA